MSFSSRYIRPNIARLTGVSLGHLIAASRSDMAPSRRAIGLGCSLALLGCGPPADTETDTTPPGFLAIQADYIRVSDGLSTGTEAIPVGGFTKAASLPTDRRLRLVASVGDSESGIASVLGPANISWTCTDPSSNLAQRKTAAMDPRSDEERTGTAPIEPPVLRNATFLVDPFVGNPLRLICPQSDEQSPAVLSMTITLSNGNGLTASTGELVFTWAGRAPGP